MVDAAENEQFSSLIDALGSKSKEELEQQGLRPLTTGFANLVWACENHGQPIVLKRYSDIVFLRMEPEALGAVDRLAWQVEIGPAVMHASCSGLVTELLPGRILEEQDMHSENWPLLKSAAVAVATLHQQRAPKECEGSPMLWRTIDRMMEGAAKSPELLPTGVPSIDVMLAEIADAKARLDELLPVVVLGHGDLKPSNMMLCSEEHHTVKLIDFELSGPNYRGYDLMKAFRSGKHNSKASMRYFLRSYAGKVEGGTADDAMVDALEQESKLFEPLTWLEAAVFFVSALPMMTNIDVAAWNELAVHRWKKFEETKHLLRSP
mmetsp:Transcript_12431/g.27651  ORF Transcript_12431/g.27651 Transcript_12431/m.27651 type:complete len:321 (+) Transcript_12431:98-1060(+)